MSPDKVYYVLQSIQIRFNVQGFPTILVFGADKSKPVPYEGARSASAIESFALEQLDSILGPVEVTELTGPVLFNICCFPNIVFRWYFSPMQATDTLLCWLII